MSEVSRSASSWLIVRSIGLRGGEEEGSSEG